MSNIHTEKINRLSAEKTKLAQIAWSVKEKNMIDKPKTCEKNNFMQNNEENYEDLDDLEAMIFMRNQKNQLMICMTIFHKIKLQLCLMHTSLKSLLLHNFKIKIKNIFFLILILMSNKQHWMIMIDIFNLNNLLINLNKT